MMNITPVVKQLLIINIIFFVGSLIVGDSANELLALFYFENPAFKGWQPITSMFMHANFMHIAFNMFALYSFGSALEHFWGGKKFLFFYISCGLGSAVLHTAVNYFQFHNALDILIQNGVSGDQVVSLLNEGQYNPGWGEILGESSLQKMLGSYTGVALGASGAIYGLLAAFAYMFPNAELALMFIPVPIKAKYFVPGIMLIDLFLGLQGESLFGSGGTGIAHFAHLGGAIVGFLMMLYWKKDQFDKNRWN